MIRRLLSVFLFTFAPMALASSPIQLKTFLQKPKLVVVIVIDQFRADYLTRFESRFLPTTGKSAPGGFRFLMEKGAYFPFAEYDVLQNMTCPGHAMILTGSLPYETRIPSNEFFDEKMGKFVYCVQDPSAPLVGAGPVKDDQGASPRRLKTSTVGDELKNAGYKSQVISISLKDRAAIMLGGRRADLATWFDHRQRRWISSRYYFPDEKLPAWLEKLNERVAKRAKTGSYVWEVDQKPTGLSQDRNQPVFTRSYDYGDEKILDSPYGLDITTEAALTALRELKLGRGKDTDLLAISYSSHDMMGHTFGPNSREMEEMTVAEDRSLNELFKALAREVPGGLKNTLLVLTADHGMAPSVPFAKQARFDAFEILYDKLLKKVNEMLDKAYGAPAHGEWTLGVKYFNFYLNHAVLTEKKVKQSDVEQKIKEVLTNEDGIFKAFTLSEYQTHSLPPVTFSRQIMNSYVPGLNGEVIAIPQPFSYFGEKPNHITGYSYDRTVPLIFAGAKLKPGVYATPAKVIDLAPTLSFLLGLLAPATNEGRVLSEAIGD